MKETLLRGLRTHKIFIFQIVVLLVLSLLPLVWFGSDYVLLGHDAGFRLNYKAQFPNIFYSWDPRINFGIDGSIFKGFLITLLPELVAQNLTQSFGVGQKIALIFWFGIPGFSMLFFLRRIFRGASNAFLQLFTSIFYMFNFFILNGWNIGERAKFSLFAALPIGLTLLYESLALGISPMRNGLLFGLVYFFLNGGGVLPLYGATIEVLGLAFVWFSFGQVRQYGVRALRRIFVTVVCFSVPFFLFNAYFISSHIALTKYSYSSSLAGQGGIEGLIAWERVISKYASITNILRLQGLPDWYDNPWHPFASQFLHNPLLIVGSLVPIAVIFLGLLLGKIDQNKRQRRIVIFLLLLLPISLLFTMGTHPPTGILYEQAMRRIPGFVMFRSSFYKFAPATWFAIIVLSGYFFQAIIHGLARSKRYFVYFIFIIGLLVYHFPFFTRDAFILANNFSTRLNVPAYIPAIASQTEQIVPIDERILVLPEMDSAYIGLPVDSYTWGYFSLDILPRNAIHRGFVANDAQEKIVQTLYASFGDQKKALSLLKRLNIHYILWRGDTAYITDDPLYVQRKNLYKNILESSKDYLVVASEGPWKLYKIERHTKTSEITASRAYDVVLGTDQAPAAYISSIEDSDYHVLSAIDVEASVADSANKTLWQTECMMCDPSEYETLVATIQLPNVKIFPGSLLYKLEEYKQEKSLRDTARSPTGRIDVYLARAQEQLVYYQKFQDVQYLLTFEKYMKQVVDRVFRLGFREKVVYANRVSAYLEAQERILGSLGENKDLLGSQRFLVDLLSQIRPVTWKSETGAYRYLVHVDASGEYEFISTDAGVLSMVMDGVTTPLSQKMSVSSGFHTIEINAPFSSQEIPLVFVTQSYPTKAVEMPQVSYTQIDSTHYKINVNPRSVGPYVLILKEHYDPRWKAVVHEGNNVNTTVREARHVLVDGFANGWYIHSSSHTIDIVYDPQKYFYMGLVISAVSLSVAFIWIIYKRKYV